MLYGYVGYVRVIATKRPEVLVVRGISILMMTKVGLCNGLRLGLLLARSAVLARRNTQWNIRLISAMQSHDHRVAWIQDLVGWQDRREGWAAGLCIR
jgi:hypothetical protein